MGTEGLTGDGGDGTVTLDEIRAWSERDEQTLRNQQPDGVFPAEVESQLERLDPTSRVGALRRWAYLKHLFYRRSERLESGEDDRAKREAARQMLRREPTHVAAGDVLVPITGRSYACLVEVHRHARALKLIRSELEEAEDYLDQVMDRAAKAPRRMRRVYRKLVRHLSDRLIPLRYEERLHRQALYAHLMTPSGAPADSLAEAPEWWVAMGPEDDLVLLAAVLDVTFGRLQALGPQPESGDRGKAARYDPALEGWITLLAQLDRDMKVEPGTYFNRDIGQVVAFLRATARTMEEET